MSLNLLWCRRMKECTKIRRIFQETPFNEVVMSCLIVCLLLQHEIHLLSQCLAQYFGFQWSFFGSTICAGLVIA